MDPIEDHLEALVARELQAALPGLLVAERGRLYEAVLARVERPLLRLVLTRTRGNKARAARLLGIHRNTLHRRLRATGLVPRRPRPAAEPAPADRLAAVASSTA